MADSVNDPGTSDLSGATGNFCIRHPIIHQESSSARGLFGKIPAELRSMIYKEAFKGSEMTLLSTPRGDGQAYPRGGRRSAFFSSGHHHLILTCHYIYNEARTMYWISTTIVNGEQIHRFSIRYLLSHLPQSAIPCIQHIRGVVPSTTVYLTTLGLGGNIYERLPVIVDEHQLKAQLPNLKAYQPCDFTFVHRYRQSIPGIQDYDLLLEWVHSAFASKFGRCSGSPAALWRITIVLCESGSTVSSLPNKVRMVLLPCPSKRATLERQSRIRY